MSMNKEDFLSNEFLSQFKTGEELSGFLKEIQKRGIEKILEAALDDHLDYDRHQKTIPGNARNGTKTK
jgi:putative transposase